MSPKKPGLEEIVVLEPLIAKTKEGYSSLSKANFGSQVATWVFKCCWEKSGADRIDIKRTNINFLITLALLANGFYFNSTDEAMPIPPPVRKRRSPRVYPIEAKPPPNSVFYQSGSDRATDLPGASLTKY
jgi:hypothetical protein